MVKARSVFPGGLHYLDLFCGSGVSAVETKKGSVQRYPGSPLLAASVTNGVDRLVLCDKSSESIEAVEQRLGRLGPSSELRTHNVDVNIAINQVLVDIPPRSLTVAFIDPFSLNVHFSTVEAVAGLGRVDLVILFADRFDLGRNVHRYYYPETEHSKLDDFLGGRDWRSRLENLDHQSGARVRELFAEIYEEKIRGLGYGYVQHWPLEGPNGPAFRMFFASKSERGEKFCRIARRESRSGQRNDLFDL